MNGGKTRDMYTVYAYIERVCKRAIMIISKIEIQRCVSRYLTERLTTISATTRIGSSTVTRTNKKRCTCLGSNTPNLDIVKRTRVERIQVYILCELKS